MRLVRVELRPGRVADNPEAIRDAQPSVARERRAPGRVDAVALEPQVVEREVSPDREQDRVALGDGSIGQVDGVGSLRTIGGARRDRPNSQADHHAVLAKGLGDDRGVPRMVGRHQPIARLHDRYGDAESDVRLGQLTARRAATEDQQAPGQGAREGRLAVGPDVDPLEARQGRHLRGGADGDDDVPGLDPVGLVVVADLDHAARDEVCRAAVHDGAGGFERLHVGGVVRLRRVRRAIDHPVAPVRGLAPRPRRRVRVVPSGRVEEGLGRQAADVRAAAADPAAIDDRDGRSALPGLERGRLAGRARADDHEVERVSHRPRSRHDAGARPRTEGPLRPRRH